MVFYRRVARSDVPSNEHPELLPGEWALGGEGVQEGRTFRNCRSGQGKRESWRFPGLRGFKWRCGHMGWFMVCSRVDRITSEFGVEDEADKRL